MSKILVVLPAYNEAKVIANVIRAIKKEGYKDILIVDDCSKDKTSQIAKKEGAKVLRHVINRGAGAATYTGIIYARNNNYDYVILIDSDGQHDPKDIIKLMKKADKYDVVIGSRMINPKGMPVSRKILNFTGSLITAFFFSIYVKDSQSGFKILNKKAIKTINLHFDRYEFCSEILSEIHKNRLTVTEVPIKVIYATNWKSRGQSIGNGFKMLARFIFRT